MNEIRFNPPIREVPTSMPRFETPLPEIKTPSKKVWWKYVAVLLVVVGLAIFGFWLVQEKLLISKANDTSSQANALSSLLDNQSGDQYSAVFLLNGQVYFGKMVSNNEKEIVLKEVYYLQASTASKAEEKKYDLIKLGTEVHGPTSEIFITRSNVLFYEILRSDSEVLNSIRNKN